MEGASPLSGPIQPQRCFFCVTMSLDMPAPGVGRDSPRVTQPVSRAGTRAQVVWPEKLGWEIDGGTGHCPLWRGRQGGRRPGQWLWLPPEAWSLLGR